MESATAEHQHEGHRRKADRRPLPLPRGGERLEGIGQDTIAIGRHVEDLRQLARQNQDRRGGGEAGEHRFGEKVGHATKTQQAEQNSEHTYQQGEQGGEGDVLGRSRGRQRLERTEGQEGGEGNRAGLQVARGDEQRGEDRRQRRREEAVLGRHPGDLGIGQGLRKSDECDRDARHQVPGGRLWHGGQARHRSSA